MTLRVDWLPRAERDGRKLDKIMRDRIRSAIERFAETGHGDVKPLLGELAGEWRLRVGEHRVIYRPYPSEQRIEIVRILPRGKAYRVRESAEAAA